MDTQKNSQNTNEESKKNLKILKDYAKDIKNYLEEIKDPNILKYIKTVLHDAIIEIQLIQFFDIEWSEDPISEEPTPDPNPPEQVHPIEDIKVEDVQILDPFQFELNFKKDFTQLDPISVILKYKSYLQQHKYFVKIYMNQLIESQYPIASAQLLSLIEKVDKKLKQFLQQQEKVASQFNNHKVENDLKPFFISIYHEQAQLDSFEIYLLMVALVQNIFPQISIQKPLPLDQQRGKEFEELTQLLPRLDKQYSIKDYSSLIQFFDFDYQIKQLKDYFKKNGKLDGEIVIQILFEFIKRKVNFKDLIKEFCETEYQINLTQIALFNYLFEHSNPQLKELLCINCASFMPLPFLSFNPWSQQLIQGKMIGELLYILEKSKAILQFKLKNNKSSFMQQKNPSGCTTLLNQLFGREFSLHEQNLINFGSVEIQMDLNCPQIEHLVVADTHGLVDIQILEKIFPFFDGFIIHLTEDQSNNLETQEILNKIFSDVSGELKRTILIIKHQQDEILNFSAEQQKKDEYRNLEIFEINTYNISQLSDNNKSNLVSKIHKVLHTFYNIDADDYRGKPAIRLKSKQTFLDILKQVNDNNCESYQITFDSVCQIIEIFQNQKNLKDVDFLPMQHYKNKERQLRELINNESTSQQEKHELKQNLDQIKETMRNETSTQIINLYSDIINRNNCMKLLPSLSSIVKGFLEYQLKEPIKEREEKKQQLLLACSDEEKIQLEKDLKHKNLSIEEKQFSIELLNREIYYLGQSSEVDISMKENYYKLVKHFEATAQPFELVDGDTLNFTSDVYQDVFQNYDNEDLLIVCVLGPQSSGKSLLMNYLFGTSFLSSSGRCTKGVYASVLNFKASNGSNKKILILDTEGIQSPEGRDPTFDKRIVYYSICISHVVLICNKGEMNQPMSETIKLVADAINNTQMPFIKNPTIYIVLNMLENP